MFENPRRGRQARNFTTNVPKILVLKSSSEQIFSRKLPLGAPDPCCKEQCVPDKGILTYTLFAATPQQTHSLHLRMLLDPHNRQHLNSKTWKTLPSLFVRLISYDIKCTSWRSLYSGQSFDHICLWRVDMSGMILAFCSSLSTDMTLTFQVPRKFRLNISRKIS